MKYKKVKKTKNQIFMEMVWSAKNQSTPKTIKCVKVILILSLPIIFLLHVYIFHLISLNFGYTYNLRNTCNSDNYG